MANFNPCCCEQETFGIVGYDLYNLQVQNFAGVFIDGKDFNSRPVKFGNCRSPIVNGDFDEWWDPDGNQVVFFTPSNNPKWVNWISDYEYACGYPMPYNINKDPVETQWVNPIGFQILYAGGSNNYWRIPRWQHPYHYPLPQTPKFFPSYSTGYGHLEDYAVGASVQPYLFTSQPGRFVIQTHSEHPGNHYIGVDDNGHIACIPFPENDPNYWAHPVNHMSPKPQMDNLTAIIYARTLGHTETLIDYETLMPEPYRSQPLYPIADWNNRDRSNIGVLKNHSTFGDTRLISPVTVGHVQAGKSIFDPSLGSIFPDLPDPQPGGGATPPPPRRTRQVLPEFIPTDHMCPCMMTFTDVYLPDAPQPTPFSTPLISEANPTSRIPFGKKIIRENNVKARLFPWTSPKTWRPYYLNFTVNGSRDTSPPADNPPYTDYMPPQPPRYFRMPKKGKIFEGPLSPQNRWETVGSYFGKYGNRGHTNWTQAAWLTWSGNTSAPTSLLTDPENKDYYNAEIQAFKRMVNACAREKNKGTVCRNGKWVTDCNDLSTFVWKERYPNQACGVGVTADPPPPCGARKLVWSLHTNKLGWNSGPASVWDAGLEHGPPIAWGEFIFREDLYGLSGATYDYELKTSWHIFDYLKNRCMGFDVPGICLAPDGTGISAGMSWQEMQGLAWTPLYPKQKSIGKQCLENSSFTVRQNYDYFLNREYNFNNFPAFNPFGIKGVTVDAAWLGNAKGWFKSYKGISGGLLLEDNWLGQGGWTFNPSYSAYKGECGVPAYTYWEEDDDAIYYRYNTFYDAYDTFTWLVSCSVPQYHKEKDQPLTKGISGSFRSRIDGELTGLGYSKNMGLFHPCGSYNYGVSGASGIENVTGLTLYNATKNISKKYKECHGCTWSNPPIWVGIDDSKAQNPEYADKWTTAYWAPEFSFFASPRLFARTNLYPCSNSLNEELVTQIFCQDASRLVEDCDFIGNVTSYANVSFTDFRIPYKVGIETYPDFSAAVMPPFPTERQFYVNACKDCVYYKIYGGPVQYPDPSNPC